MINSNILIDGFEQFRFETDMKKVLERSGYALDGTSFLELEGRLSGSALSMTNSTMAREVQWPGRYLSVGVAFFMEARAPLIQLMIAGEPVIAWMDAEQGGPRLNERLGGSLPWLKTWYYAEVQLDRDALTASLWLNSRDEVVNLPITLNQATADTVTVAIGTKAPAAAPPWFNDKSRGNVFFDDFYIHLGERLGPVAVTTRFPTAPGTTQWIKSPLAVDNLDAVTRRPTEEVDVNIASDVIGNADYYTSATVLANNEQIIATGMCVLARKSPALDAKLGVFIGDDAAAARREDDIAVTGTWESHYTGFTGQADTKAGIEAAPFGVEVAAP